MRGPRAWPGGTYVCGVWAGGGGWITFGVGVVEG